MPGEVIEVETWDCFAGLVKPNQTLKDILKSGIRRFRNPVTGPIYIEGAEPGDTLAISLLDISVPEMGITTITPTSGCLDGWMVPPCPLTKFLQIRNGEILYELNDRRIIRIPVRPFVGTIGVSPAFEVVSTVVPGKHGGNMDVPEVCPYNILYLPVNTEGALLGLGDVHAIQGDGEICGTAVEISSVVKIKVDLIKNRTIDWPRIESSDEIMTVCSSRSLEDAVRLAFLELIKWLETDYGFEKYDAYNLLSIAGHARLAQIVNPLFTVVAKLKKSLLSCSEK
jgi:acetamidase/formamidase